MAAKEVKYRITGPQSISRLEPLLAGMRGITCVPSTSSTEPLDFVWETTCKAVERQQHVDATVLNRLHNSQVIEDKANLAFLQLSVATCARHCLTTYVAAGRADVAAWAERQWPTVTTTTTTTTTTTVFTAATAAAAAAQPPTAEWWFVKASKGNGGKDIWIMNATNFRDVVAELPTTGTDDYVIQRYAPDPMLWDGKKFHFRVYAAMRADASAWLYHRAFVLTAGVAHDSAAPGDVNKHVSNLSINKHIRGHPGQIPVDLARDHAALFEEMQAMWGAVVAAAEPHMTTQRRPGHFEFFGLDVVADTAGGCWLIEANRLVGLGGGGGGSVLRKQLHSQKVCLLM